MYPGLPSRLEKDLKKLYLEKVLKGNKEGLKVLAKFFNLKRKQKFKCRVEAPPRRKNMVFEGGSVLAETMKDKDAFWMNKLEYEEIGEAVLKKCFYEI